MKKNIRSRNLATFITVGTILVLGLTIWINGWGQIRESDTDAAEVSTAMPVIKRESDDPDGRSNWFMEQRMYPFDKVPDNARRNAWQDVLDRGEGFGPAGIGTTWTPLGPAPTSGAGPGGFVSGRINAIAISPANTQLILVAGSTGGIWRSTNGGTTFVPVTDSLVDLAVGTIAFAPSDPNIVYAGLGDNDNGYWGTGVLRSNDAGATWTRVSTTPFPERVQATRILVDPANPNRVYIALHSFLVPTSGNPGTGGVLVSTNGGVSWAVTLNGLASDLAIHPTNPQIIYAALRYGATAPSPRGLFKSINGGQTWTNVLASPYTADQNSTKDFRIAVTPADPDRVYAYFGTEGPPKEVRLEVSNDAGASFTDRGVISNMILDPGQFGYNTFLEASPTDANTVYVGARDIFRSTDGGTSFTNLVNSHAPPYDPGNFTEALQKMHTDQQSFAFEPGSSTTFYAGNDGGIFKTTNSGSTFTSLNNTLSLVQFIGITLHPTDSSRSYGGAQDNGTQRRVSVGQIWREFVGGDGGKAVINPVDPTMVFPSYTNGNIGRVTNNGSGPSSDIATSAVFGEKGDNARIGFYPPIVGNGVDPRIYSGSWRLFICTDCNDLNKAVGTPNPPTWTAPGGMFDQTKGGVDVLSAITVAPSSLNTIYTGSAQGRAMVSTNGGATWTDISTGLPDRSIRNITVSPTDPALVYLTVSGYRSGHIFLSNNGGTTWTDISNNLPDIPVSAFLIDRLTSTTLYAGTDIGVFRSTDNGGSWTVFNNGMPPAPVMEFTSQATGLIQLATYGRGAYELRVPGVPTPTPTSTPTATPTPTPAGQCAFSNGGLNPQTLSENFTEPPPGFFFSELQHAPGVTTEANGSLGFGATQGTARLADDFTLSQPCNIGTVALYGYVTGSAATPSPFTGLTLQIWNGRPGDAGSTVVFGDTTTNRLASSVDSTYFRISNTAVPVTGTPPGTTRRIWRNTATVGIVLPAGTYWLDWASTGGGAGNFAPAKTIPSARNAAGDNARRLTVSTGVWADILDSGSPAAAPDLIQDMPFDVVGSTTGTPTPTATPTATPTPMPSPGFESDIAPRPNGDGLTITNDVVQARRFVSGLDTPNTATSEFQRTDSAPRSTFGDGALSSADVVQTRRYASGLDPQTAAGGPTSPPVAPGIVSEFLENVYAFFFGSELRVGLVETYAGATVTVPIGMTSSGNEAAISFTVEYDANKLSNPRVVNGDTAVEGTVLTVNTGESGRIGVLVDSTEVMSSTAKPRSIVLVTFDVATDAAGDTAVVLTGNTATKSASDASGKGLSMRWIDGYVRISAHSPAR